MSEPRVDPHHEPDCPCNYSDEPCACLAAPPGEQQRTARVSEDDFNAMQAILSRVDLSADEIAVVLRVQSALRSASPEAEELRRQRDEWQRRYEQLGDPGIEVEARSASPEARGPSH